MSAPILEPASIDIDDLLLDPNNPRFVERLDIGEEIPDSEVESKQKEIRKKFRSADGATAEQNVEESFSIKDLYVSMEDIGFVPIDRVVVRNLDGSTKCLVIEGNRRVCTAKNLLEDNQSRRPDKQLDPEIVESLKTIEVLVLKTEGLTSTEIHDQVGVILGLRHYGSVLEWEPLPKAFNIFKEYKHLPPSQIDFKVEVSRFRSVASRLSIKWQQVRDAIKTYIAYLQLGESLDGVEPKYYSLIEALITNGRLTNLGYIESNSETFQLTEPSIERLEKVCQFDVRSTGVEGIILRDPQSVSGFSKLVQESHIGEGAVKDFARGKLSQVEEGEVSLEDALDHLNTFKRTQGWVDGLSTLLDKREEHLQLSSFQTEGNDLLQKDELERAFRNLRLILLSDR